MPRLVTKFKYLKPTDRLSAGGYDNGNTKAGYGILGKFENISAKTCICCGQPATRITKGWISPYCDDCCPQDEPSVPVSEYLSDN